MPLQMQVKLLRVLQEREIDRIGGSAPIPVDVRVLAATRRDLHKMMEEGTFREDLYYRLAVVNIQTVPLRECPGDILLHAFHHLNRLNRQYRTEITLSETAKECLLLHSWPGNIRELQNVLSSAYAMCDGNMIEPENLPQQIARFAQNAEIDRKEKPEEISASSNSLSLKEKLRRYETALISDAVQAAGGNMAEAARRLKVERSLLYKKMDKLGMK